jgi:hypothetical protein
MFLLSFRTSCVNRPFVGYKAKFLGKDPLSYLDSELKKMTAANRMMRLKFEELAFDVPATAPGGKQGAGSGRPHT